MTEPKAVISEPEAKWIFRQLIYGIEYLHSRNIAHRDIKLENIIFEKSLTKVKLVDFGFATCLREQGEKIKIFCGTPTYMAPEIVSKEHSGYAAPPADVWALGVVLYLLLSGRFPFKPPKVDSDGLPITKAKRNQQLFK